MLITTPADIQAVWEGELEEPVLSFDPGAPARPFVTLGRAEAWPVAQALASETGKQWVPPLGGAQYWLVRLACTLRPPPPGTVITAAVQRLYLFPQPQAAGAGCAYAQALFPLQVGVEGQGEFSLGLGPELGFIDGSSLKIGELGAKIQYRKVFPAIQAFGLGEAAPYWEFKPHAARPLLGSQYVYAVLGARPPAHGLRAQVELTVTTRSAAGIFKYGTPAEARQYTGFSLPFP